MATPASSTGIWAQQHAGAAAAAVRERARRSSGGGGGGGGGGDVYDVEAILAERVTRGERWYLVKWVGYGEKRSTWEPRSNLATCTVFLAHLRSAAGGIAPPPATSGPAPASAPRVAGAGNTATPLDRGATRAVPPPQPAANGNVAYLNNGTPLIAGDVVLLARDSSHAGTIVRVHDNRTLDIHYHDGSQEEGVAAADVRPMIRGAKKSAAKALAAQLQQARKALGPKATCGGAGKAKGKAKAKGKGRAARPTPRPPSKGPAPRGGHMPFRQALQYARSLGLADSRTWRAWCGSGDCPGTMPYVGLFACRPRDRPFRCPCVRAHCARQRTTATLSVP